MAAYVLGRRDDGKGKHPAKPEFHPAVQEVAESLELVLEKRPE